MTTELIPVEPAPLVQLGTLQANTPTGLVKGAVQIANTLAQLIRQQKLASQIHSREYVRVEGWTVLGALLGVIAREESVIEKDDGTYLATVALVRMSDEVVVSRASAECGMDEPTWASRPRYARRSMALTRATGKASRLAFSWIMTMAGFEPTPLEEMPTEGKLLESDSDRKHSATDLVGTGKYARKSWQDVSGDYLSWVVGEGAAKCRKHLLPVAQAEIARRAAVFTGGISDDKDIPYESEAGVRG
jgi:hypothetical protein